jgi:hypothetical protein
MRRRLKVVDEHLSSVRKTSLTRSQARMRRPLLHTPCRRVAYELQLGLLRLAPPSFAGFELDDIAGRFGKRRGGQPSARRTRCAACRFADRSKTLMPSA